MTTSSTQGTHGAIHLMTENDAATATMRRTVRLEAAVDGKSLLLIDVDTRKPGIQRAVSATFLFGYKRTLQLSRYNEKIDNLSYVKL
jgi:Mrp family chromosome partitioning ATPase